MKNDQKNQGQDTNSKNNQRDQQQGGNKQGQSGAGDSSAKANQSSSSQNSNISVGNDGKIGKAHDQWNSNDKTNQQYDKKNTGFQPNDRQSGDRTDSDIDLLDTDKKTPQMQGNKDKR